MTKSEELAKLLGIEPKIKFTCPDCGSFPMRSNEYCIHCGSVHIRNMEHYPEFTKPSNFVKLLEIFCQNATDVNASLVLSTNDPINELITDIIQGLQNNEFGHIPEQRKFIKLAQQVEWEY